MALVQLASLKVFLSKPFVTLDVCSDFLLGRWKLNNCKEIENVSLENKVRLQFRSEWQFLRFTDDISDRL